MAFVKKCLDYSNRVYFCKLNLHFKFSKMFKLHQTRVVKDQLISQSRVVCNEQPVEAWLTWLSVTNSASRPTRSLACGISLTMRGMKVAWLFLCFRASEASVSSTLASMGFLTEKREAGESLSHTRAKCKVLGSVNLLRRSYLVW